MLRVCEENLMYAEPMPWSHVFQYAGKGDSRVYTRGAREKQLIDPESLERRIPSMTAVLVSSLFEMLNARRLVTRRVTSDWPYTPPL